MVCESCENSIKTGKDLSIQLHTGTKIFDGTKIKPIHSHIFGKPRGGFWTSSYTPDEKYASDWVRWGAGNLDSADVEYKVDGVLLEVSPNARIFEIHNAQDIRDLFEKYGTLFHGRADFDWDKIIQDFDGIHATLSAISKLRGFPQGVDVSDLMIKKGLIEKREIDTFEYELDLYPWDAESSVFFRDVFVSQKPIEITYKGETFI